MKSGILIIDKAVDFTSHDVVAKLRGILRTKKIGHTGTLDPFATGVLVILVGKATRLAKYIDKSEKSYEAIFRFGFDTETGDRTGNVKNFVNNASVKKADVEKVLPLFRGEIEQIPPMYSAKKIKGKKLYELARKGIEIERKPVLINVSELDILEELNSKVSEAEDSNTEINTSDFKLKIKSSAGTYIRVLAEDVGHKINVPCHLAELRRTQAGEFKIENAVTLEELEKLVAEEKLDQVLLPMNKAVSHLAKQSLSNKELNKIYNGMKIESEQSSEKSFEIVLTDESGNLISIGEYIVETNQIQPRLVFKD